ncbi:hypothetical protein PGT21_034963 [Puccinia graminis f. sp. tritici]|uniref:Uncharacterized protein n=1 Tax=Puccinia graminis f. sp. tritici TaxID=56615 RepID=A0A5B0PN58_PUCGR|nr:hypothetical protein PGT21_034963 [Puccinia graminis f. sp. tritici]
MPRVRKHQLEAPTSSIAKSNGTTSAPNEDDNNSSQSDVEVTFNPPTLPESQATSDATTPTPRNHSVNTQIEKKKIIKSLAPKQNQRTRKRRPPVRFGLISSSMAPVII